MSILINIATISTGVILIGIILNLLVEKKISESQSILWILIGFLSIVLGLFPKLINIMANKLGIWYAPSLTFLVAYIGLLFIVLRTTVITSVQSNQINELFMEVILVKKENEDLKQELDTLKREGE